MNKQKEILDRIKYKRPEVPDERYFIEMAKKIQQMESSAKVIPLYRRPAFYLAISAAASLVLFFTVFTNNSNKINDINLAAELQEVKQSEVLAYIDENIDDFEIELIAEFTTELKEEGLQEIVTNDNSESLPELNGNIETELNELDKDAILEYLKENGIDQNEEIESYEFI
ncbi:MAG: hypothetical protein EP333_05125 [Bacteroidetes bacterium]|nr:MAG: hypothetical protein EP333_05125 [Bacteroidota bacterium]